MEQELAASMAREVKLSQAIKTSQTEVNLTDEQAQIASALVLSLEEEQKRKAIPSKEEIKAEAQEH